MELSFILEYILNNKLELFAALAGIICVWLNTRNNHWGWFFGIMSVTPYIYIFFVNGLYGDSILSLFYLIISIWGWYNWVFGGKTSSEKFDEGGVLDNNTEFETSTELPISRMSLPYWIISLTLGTVGVFVMGWWFSTLPNATLPYYDAFTTSFSVVAQFHLAKKWIENWLFWIVIDIVCVGVYYYKGLYFTTGLYAILVVLATVGYFEWKRQMKLSSSSV